MIHLISLTSLEIVYQEMESLVVIFLPSIHLEISKNCFSARIWIIWKYEFLTFGPLFGDFNIVLTVLDGRTEKYSSGRKLRPSKYATEVNILSTARRSS